MPSDLPVNKQTIQNHKRHANIYKAWTILYALQVTCKKEELKVEEEVVFGNLLTGVRQFKLKVFTVWKTVSVIDGRLDDLQLGLHKHV